MPSCTSTVIVLLFSKIVFLYSLDFSCNNLICVNFWIHICMSGPQEEQSPLKKWLMGIQINFQLMGLKAIADLSFTSCILETSVNTKNLFVHTFFRQADPDSFWPLGCGDMSGQIRVLHRRWLLHRLRVQRCNIAAVVLEWTAPYYRRQSK